MSKNILVLSGSPRKGGNSDLLCGEFARGAQEAGHSVEGAREMGAIIGSGVYEPGKVKNSPAMKQAYEMGKRA